MGCASVLKQHLTAGGLYLLFVSDGIKVTAALGFVNRDFSLYNFWPAVWKVILEV